MEPDIPVDGMAGMNLDKQVRDPRDLSDEDQERFNALIVKSKKYVGEGRIEDALKLNKKALALCYSEKLAKKIKKMEDYLKERGEESEDEMGMMHLGKGFYLYRDLYEKLYVHQQEGVLWLWSLYRQRKGGILGDDMGLGKTIQVIAFLSGMFDMQKISSVLIILPVALMVNWENELKKWAPGLKVVAFHGNSKREKERALARVQRRGGICLTTYGLVVTSWEQLGDQDGREFVWDYMILDEGHKIKNPTKTSKGVHAIPAKNRIILTGTPVQNNLKELWALFDFVHQGSLLGTQRTFKMEYDTPITRAREKDATNNEKRLGMEMAESLKRIISPFFLRRTKAEVKERESKDKQSENSTGKHAVMPTMTRKNDLIVWTFLSEAQLKIYDDFLHLESVKELLMTSKSPLVALNVLKKICDHPRLLSTRACSQLGIEGDEGLDEDVLETEAGNLSAVTRIQHVADHILVNESGKLVFLVSLLDQLRVEGHRCLVFSQSRKMLDIMEKVLTNKGHKIMRLDGTISQVQEREQRIQKFQSDNSYSVFLLTTQVGGVGLTLTAANRVVIYDPSWNPATDAQAVDRVFRIGQNKNVVIYRLITCGTVEEKIYRRQVFKDSITRQTTGNAKNPYRYFSKYELRELFTLDDPKTSTTQQQLDEMYSGQRLTDPSLDEHIAFLYSLEMFGLSDHDLMFTQGKGRSSETDDEHEDDQDQENQYIQHRVQKAQELLQMESQQEIPLEERQGKHQGPTGPAGPRNHMWEFPKPKQEVEEHTETEESMEEDEVNTTASSADKHEGDDSMVDLTSPTPNHKVTNIKKEPSPHIDLTTPVIKQENEPLTGDSRELLNTPKRPVTPKTVREEVIISPDPQKPLIQMSPLKKVNLTSSVERAKKASNKLNATLFSHEESPAITANNSATNNARTLVGDSPMTEARSSITDSRNESRDIDDSVDDGKGPSEAVDDCDIINESVIDESMVSENGDVDVMETSHRGDISVHEVKDILERSLMNGAGDQEDLDMSDIQPRRRVNARRSISARKPVIESSEEDEEEMYESADDKEENGDDDEVDNEISDDHENDNNQDDESNSVNDDHDNECDNNYKENHENHQAEDDNIDDDDQSDKENQYEQNGDLNTSAKRDLNTSAKRDLNTSVKRDLNTSANQDLNTSAKRVLNTSAKGDFNTSASRDINSSALRDLNTSAHMEFNTSGRRNSDKVGHDSSRLDQMITDDNTEDVLENEAVDDDNDDDSQEYSDEEEIEEFDDLPEEDQLRYNELVEMGRSLCQSKRYEEGQAMVLQALEIYPDEELQKTAVAIQKKILKKQMRDGMSQLS